MRDLKNTPWGDAQFVKQIAPGITRVSASGDGGYHLSPGRIADMPDALRAINTRLGHPWFEEDVDWCLVVLSFPDAFDPYKVFCALRTLRSRAADTRHPEPAFTVAEALFKGEARQKVEDIANDWFLMHRNWWEMRGYSFGSNPSGHIALYVSLATGKRVRRFVADAEFLELPVVVPQLPGVPA